MESSVFEQWHVEYNSGIPVYRQIINQVCAAVAAGVFKAGDQLPTIRALHERLQVNPNTVAKAYRELELKGVIVSERGSGSFIKEQPQVRLGTASIGENGPLSPSFAKATAGRLALSPLGGARELANSVGGGAGGAEPAPAPTPLPAAEAVEKKDRLKSIYNRLLSEAAGSGLTESELLNFIKERNPSTL